MTPSEIASTAGLSNYRLLDPETLGGIGTCAGVPEMITANADWPRVVVTRFMPGGILPSRAPGA
jgi:hypothetical protein